MPKGLHRRYGFALAGYVVMPNHIHLLIGEPPNDTSSTPYNRRGKSSKLIPAIVS
jgi:REP element-mobilizing transposase RayT